MFQGVTKRMKISRRVVENDNSVRKEEKVLTINVKPGWKTGTKITFQREGDQVSQTAERFYLMSCNLLL